MRRYYAKDNIESLIIFYETSKKRDNQTTSMIKEVRITVTEEEGSYSYPVNLPKWMLKLLLRFLTRYE